MKGPCCAPIEPRGKGRGERRCAVAWFKGAAPRHPRRLHKSATPRTERATLVCCFDRDSRGAGSGRARGHRPYRWYLTRIPSLCVIQATGGLRGGSGDQGLHCCKKAGKSAEPLIAKPPPPRPPPVPEPGVRLQSTVGPAWCTHPRKTPQTLPPTPSDSEARTGTRPRLLLHPSPGLLAARGLVRCPYPAPRPWQAYVQTPHTALCRPSPKQSAILHHIPPHSPRSTATHCTTTSPTSPRPAPLLWPAAHSYPPQTAYQAIRDPHASPQQNLPPSPNAPSAAAGENAAALQLAGAGQQTLPRPSQMATAIDIGLAAACGAGGH